MFRFSYDSGLNGKCGVYGQSGLYDKSGLYPVEFNVQNLDPYLLFDTSQGSMLGTLESPTLDLDPSNPDTLNVITASRSSVATRTLPDGRIALAEQDTVRVEHTQGEQLTPTKFQRVPYSTPDSNWTTSNSTLVEDFDAAPDGTQSASKITKLAGIGSDSGNDRIKYPSIAIANGTTYSVSVHLKNIDVAGFTTIAARVSGGSLFRVKFTWNTSALSSDSGTTSNRLVEDLGEGWYRVSFSFESNGAAADFEIDIDRSTGGREDTSSILVWGAQLEEGTTASSFVANTTGSPKFTGISATYSARVPMILVEPSATNLLPYSEDFSNAAWTKNNVTLTADYGIAPDGNNTSTRIQYSGTSYIQDSFAVSDYTVSAFVKGVAGQVVRFGIGANVAQGADFTLSGEWQRIEYTGSGGTIFFSTFGGNTATDFEIWGAQVETGSVATSYIPTSGSTVTRAADELVISGSDLTDFYNQSEGTFYMEVIDKNILDSTSHLYLHGGGNNLILYSNGNSTNVANYDGANFLQFSGIPSNQLIRMALSYESSTKKLSVNGNTSSDSTYNGNYAGISSLTLGTNLNGHLKRLIYWPTESGRL